MSDSEHISGSGRIELTTYDPAEVRIPICWKCSNRITAPSETNEGCFTLTGCKANSDINNYEDAKELCPIIHLTNGPTNGPLLPTD